MQNPKYIKMLVYNILFFTIVLISSFTFCSPNQNPQRKSGLILPLIPPTSPHSPFYNEILEAYKIPPTTKNFTLDRTDYLEWVARKMSLLMNEYGEVSQPKGWIYHVMGMYMGDPEQLVYGIFDTGSDMVWFQCEDTPQKGMFPYYNQSKSRTYKTINCKDKTKCNSDSSHAIKKCRDPDQGTCEFDIMYGDGSHADGVMATDVTTFKPSWEIFHDFIFGCSKDNARTMGIIGASNSDYSLVNQLYPDNPKFSYCISEDLSKTSLVKYGPEANLRGQSLDMIKNSHSKYYYIDVVSIRVNGENIGVQPSEFEMSDNGSKGFIIDSGSMLTSLPMVPFLALQKKIEHFLGRPSRYLVYQMCYPTWSFGSWWPLKKKPKIAFEFTDFIFELDDNRAWAKMKNSELECLQVIRSWNHISILGSEQLLNVNVGHDPVNDLLYLEKTTCPLKSPPVLVG